MTTPTRFSTLFLLSLAALAIGLAAPPRGFTSLFNGRDLSGWRGGQTFDHRALLEMPEAERAETIAEWTKSLTEVNEKTGQPHWRVEKGVLVNDGFGGYATTEKDYGDFEFLVEYNSAPKTDSGIYLRGVPQVQIWDHTEADPKGHGKAKGSGGLWNNSKGAPGKDPLVRADKPAGQWNRLRILMVGSRVSVWLNNKRVVDHAILENHYDRRLPEAERRPVPPRGPIQLQTHGGEIRWRNIFIREIGGDEANRILAVHGKEGFESIFNGKNLDGWAGALDAVEVEDRRMRWLTGKGGTLYWNKELADFQNRLEFTVPSAGNNGLAIRYPGTGMPAYDGMCELQILAENYEDVKGPIDPRQRHGSAYLMTAAAQGYQRPIGEWNFQEVTVQGSRIRVELNGTVILDTDLAQLDPSGFGGKRPHAGRSRTSGFFGFAGHNDPVQFRNIAIKTL